MSEVKVSPAWVQLTLRWNIGAPRQCNAPVFLKAGRGQLFHEASPQVLLLGTIGRLTTEVLLVRPAPTAFEGSLPRSELSMIPEMLPGRL